MSMQSITLIHLSMHSRSLVIKNYGIIIIEDIAKTTITHKQNRKEEEKNNSGTAYNEKNIQQQ